MTDDIDKNEVIFDKSGTLTGVATRRLGDVVVVRAFLDLDGLRAVRDFINTRIAEVELEQSKRDG